MTGEEVPPRTAQELRRVNSELDAALLRLVTSSSQVAMHTPVEPEWSVLQVVVHLGEFPHFFAKDLRRWQRDRSAVMGRTHEHPARLAAVAETHAAQMGLDSLTARAHAALADLAESLGGLTDEDLHADTINMKYGDEPLSAFLDRYVIEHERGRRAQLERLATLG